MIFNFKAFLSLVLSFTLLFCVACAEQAQTKPQDDSSAIIPEDEIQTNPDLPDSENITQPTYQSTGTSVESLPDWSAEKLVQQNIASPLPILTRCFYPDHNQLLKNLISMRAALGTSIKTAGVLSQFLFSYNAEASGLDLYLDYAESTFVKYGSDVYGADPAGIGGGSGYHDMPEGEFQFIVTNDDEFYHALKEAKKGDIIYIADNTVIDLSDWILPGDIVDFSKEESVLERVPLQFTIPTGVTLLGARGYADSSGAMIKSSSHVNFILTLEKNARISGLVIQGCDLPIYASSSTENQSSGIRVIGDGATIDNCEIAGFSGTAILVENAQDVKIHHNYIHHSLGWEAGCGIRVDNSKVLIERNLFSQLRMTLSAEGFKSDISYQNNVDAGNIRSTSFVLKNTLGTDSDFSEVFTSVSRFVCKNNTFLSASPVFTLLGLPQSMVVQNNLFAYQDCVYGDEILTLPGLSSVVYETRVQFTGNCFDIKAPYLSDKTSKTSQSGDARLSSYAKLVKDGLTPPKPKKSDLPQIKFEKVLYPDVICASYYSNDHDFAFVRISDLAAMTKSSGVKVNQQSLDGLLVEIISSLGGYSSLYTLSDLLYIEKGGTAYGAKPQDQNPIGVYTEQEMIYTTGDYLVYSLTDLLLAASMAKRGDVIYIPEGVVIDVSAVTEEKRTIIIKQGVTLASDRGFIHEDGRVSTGALIYCSRVQAESVFILGEESRLTGLSLSGPDPAAHNGLWERALRGHTVGTGYQYGHNYLANAQPTVGVTVVGDGAVIDNCEIAGFSGAAITIRSCEDGKTSENVKIHHCYIHHNQMMAFGYGISLGYAYAEIYCNLFNYNRHSISGSGFADSGYIAHNNIEMGSANGHVFNMHGGSDRKDGTDIAGGTIKIYNNTILSSALPYILRGAPSKSMEFYSNILFVSRDDCTDGQLIRERVEVGRNIWNIGENNPTALVG